MQILERNPTMISSGLYWLTSNLNFSSFSFSPDCSAIKGDFSPCVHNYSSSGIQVFGWTQIGVINFSVSYLQPSRMSSHRPGHPWKHLCVPICVAAITADLRYSLNVSQKETMRNHLSCKFQTLVRPNLGLSIFLLLTKCDLFGHFDCLKIVKSRFLYKH